MEMLDDTDYVLAPSQFVRQSFLDHHFPPGRILQNVYPVDLSCFTPPRNARLAERPLTIINTGMISLRKGAPYMFEAFRLIHQRHPSTRFMLTNTIHDSAREIVSRYSDLPIDWAPPLGQAQLAERLRSADIFMLLSIEEGLVRTALEAMACGLPVILTPNTGANDFTSPDLNGEVVPIRNSQSAAAAALKWADRALAGEIKQNDFVAERLSFQCFQTRFLDQLNALKL